VIECDVCVGSGHIWRQTLQEEFSVKILQEKHPLLITKIQAEQAKFT
jgi:hypothetical protein